jgi:hypothetical protein
MEDYTSALRSYLAQPSEQGLAAAYRIGRAAVEQGTGLFDILTAHFEVVGHDAGDATVSAAHLFLFECVAPLEMAYRGFIDANTSLRQVNAELARVNATLERVVEERTAQLSHALREVQAHAAARQRYAREVNDSIVQALVAAETAADLDMADESRRLLRLASRSARAWIGELLRDAGPLKPGMLVRARPAERTEQDT